MSVSLSELEDDFRAIETAISAALTKLAAYDRAGDAALDGFVSTAVAIRTVCHMNPGVAKGHVELARKLESLPIVAEAFAKGTISRARTEVRHHGHLSTATLERIACDAQISRVIMAGQSEILDVGRTTRTVTAAQWTALVARDRHCQAPGCTRPPADCEAHHIDYWSHGGPTSLANLKLLCWKHHRQQHTHDNHQRPHRPAPFTTDRAQHTYRARKPTPIARHQRI